MATQDRTHRDDAADTRQKVGRWEWVALPEFGISCMKSDFF